MAAGAGTDNKMYFFQLQKEPEGSFCFGSGVIKTPSATEVTGRLS
jgi:hypothetical protein